MPKLIIELSDELTLGDLLKAIDSGHRGFVVVKDKEGTLLGVVTDGDLRRAMIGGASVSSHASKFINANCTFIEDGADREAILRLLDQKIKFVPVVTIDRKVVRIVTIDDLHYEESKGLVAKSRAPSRISFGGGGTDLTPFFVEHGGAVLNAAINLYSRATLRQTPDSLKVKITSEDFGVTVEAESWESLNFDGKLDLLKAAIKLLRPSFGFELNVASEFPPSSGLGGSSVVLAAVIGVFNQFRSDKLSNFDIAELAFQAERLLLNCAGGWQDQYAAVFGGINFLEFRKDRNEINSLKIQDEILMELEDRLVICYSGGSHPVNSIHAKQVKKMTQDMSTLDFAHKTRDLAFAMKHTLQRGRLDEFGMMLHEAWNLKKGLAEGISNEKLNSIYEFALENGAVGGKILGAGGGGYFLFQTKPFARQELINALENKGFNAQSVMFEHSGMKSWLVR